MDVYLFLFVLLLSCAGGDLAMGRYSGQGIIPNNYEQFLISTVNSELKLSIILSQYIVGEGEIT
jgi:hypothetical protein